MIWCIHLQHWSISLLLSLLNTPSRGYTIVHSPLKSTFEGTVLIPLSCVTVSLNGRPSASRHVRTCCGISSMWPFSSFIFGGLFIFSVALKLDVWWSKILFEITEWIKETESQIEEQRGAARTLQAHLASLKVGVLSFSLIALYRGLCSCIDLQKFILSPPNIFLGTWFPSDVYLINFCSKEHQLIFLHCFIISCMFSCALWMVGFSAAQLVH